MLETLMKGENIQDEGLIIGSINKVHDKKVIQCVKYGLKCIVLSTYVKLMIITQSRTRLYDLLLAVVQVLSFC